MMDLFFNIQTLTTTTTLYFLIKIIVVVQRLSFLPFLIRKAFMNLSK